MLFEERMHFQPRVELQHAPDVFFREGSRSVPPESQRFKSPSRWILSKGSEVTRDILWKIQCDCHGINRVALMTPDIKHSVASSAKRSRNIPCASRSRPYDSGVEQSLSAGFSHRTVWA